MRTERRLRSRGRAGCPTCASSACPLGLPRGDVACLRGPAGACGPSLAALAVTPETQELPVLASQPLRKRLRSQTGLHVTSHLALQLPGAGAAQAGGWGWSGGWGWIGVLLLLPRAVPPAPPPPLVLTGGCSLAALRLLPLAPSPTVPKTSDRASVGYSVPGPTAQVHGSQVRPSGSHRS